MALKLLSRNLCLLRLDTLKLCTAFIHDKGTVGQNEVVSNNPVTEKNVENLNDSVPEKNVENVNNSVPEKNVANLNNSVPERKLKYKEADMPIKMKNPYEREKPKCILCKYDIEPDYKNVRLLSQFVSRYTGRIYGRYITGLCESKQKKVELEIRKARLTGLMGVYYRDPKFLADPDLYDSSKPFKYL